MKYTIWVLIISACFSSLFSCQKDTLADLEYAVDVENEFRRDEYLNKTEQTSTVSSSRSSNLSNGIGDCTNGNTAGHISGKVSFTNERFPQEFDISTYIVRAYDADKGADDLMCLTTLKADGSFHLKYDRSTEKWEKKKPFSTSYRPDIYIIIERPQNNGCWNTIYESAKFDNHRMSSHLVINPLIAVMNLRHSDVLWIPFLGENCY